MSRHLADLSDIDLITRALEVETLRKIDRPSTADLTRFKRIAVLAPHQDDEMIGAGGLSVLASESGAAVSFVFLTDGAERGMAGVDGTTLRPPEAAAIRQAEAREVCAALGAEYSCLGIDNTVMAVERHHVASLSGILVDFAPDLILLPWLFDSAPKHRMATQLLWLALRNAAPGGAEIWGYQVNNGLFANRVLDITSVIDRKLELIGLYESQNSFLRRYDHQAMGLGAWNSRYLPSKGTALAATYAELFLALTQDEFGDLVERFYLNNLKAVYGGSTRLVHSMSALHAAMVGPGAGQT